MAETEILRSLRRFLDQPENECWIWTGPKYGQGYGGVRLVPFTEQRGPRAAYRVMYELFRGSIPSGLQIDHLCRVRRCVNPRHLEAVTCAENLRRGEGFIGVQSRRTHCVRGHPLSGTNLFMAGTHRGCRECGRLHARKRYWRMVADPVWKAKERERIKLWKREWKRRVRAARPS